MDINEERIENLKNEITELSHEIQQFRYYINSEGKKVDLHSNKYTEQTKHLKKDEKKKIDAQRKKYHVAVKKLNSLKTNLIKLENNLPENLDILENFKEQLLELFGKFYSASQVHNYILTEIKIAVSYKMVLAFQKKNHTAIEELRTTFNKTVTSTLRLAHKGGRLEELSELYFKTKAKFTRHETNENAKLLTHIIEQIRKEVEGERITLEGNINIEQTINVHIRQEVLKNVNVQMLVLSRVAAQRNIDPLWILSKLQASYYAKHNGFITTQTEDEEEIVYPSQLVYDFETIKKVNQAQKAQIEEEKKTMQLSHELAPEEKEQINSFKEQLIAKIKKKQLNKGD